MNLYLEFDIINKNLAVNVSTFGSAVLPVKAEYFSEQFFEEVKHLLRSFLVDKQSGNSFVILPNEAVGFDAFNVPNAKRLHNAAFSAQMSALFEGEEKNKRVNRFLIDKNRQYTVYGAVMTDANLILSINKLLSEIKWPAKLITYSANALLTGFLAEKPKYRGKSFILAQMDKRATEVVCCSAGRALGYATVPYGTDIMEKDKSVDGMDGKGYDVRYENFKIIARRILLYARQVKLRGYATSPDFAVINMPQQLHFLVDRFNNEPKQDFDFRAINEKCDLLKFRGAENVSRINEKHYF